MADVSDTPSLKPSRNREVEVCACASQWEGGLVVGWTEVSVLGKASTPSSSRRKVQSLGRAGPNWEGRAAHWQRGLLSYVRATIVNLLLVLPLQHSHSTAMRLPSLLGLLLGLVGIAAALSASGNRLLVILEEEGERSKYSQFWLDLESQ